MILYTLLVAAATFFISGLTLFSGFGLGTLLMPVLALFFPIEHAVAVTALVHFLNNLFKLGLMGRYAVKRVVVTFGIPALLAAAGGAWLLVNLAHLTPIFTYSLGEKVCEVTWIGLCVGTLVLVFAFLDLKPAAGKQPDEKWLPAAGALSGFLGGLSGHQGAFRSAWLLRLGLGRDAFIGTGVVIACLVDASRMLVYGGDMLQTLHGAHARMLAVAVAAAFAGSWTAKKFLKKVTLEGLHRGLSAALALIGIGIACGLF